MKIKYFITKLLASLLIVKNQIYHFIFPSFCIICHATEISNDDLVCENCWHSFPPADEADQITANLKLLFKDQCFFERAFSLWKFSPNVQQIIHLLKYSEYDSLGKKIGQFMAAKMTKFNLPYNQSILIPVPLHSTRKRERGYNQSAIICRTIADLTGIEYNENILTRIRYTETQTRLSVKKRFKNVQNAFRVISSDKIRDKLVILIDDVLTTGATMNACASELKQSGARKIYLFSAVKP